MRGWILDLYTESPGKMVVWLKLEGGETRRLVDRWAPSLFVASGDAKDLADIEKGRGRDFSWSRRVMRYERATDASESEVLELVVDDAKKLAPLAESVERSRQFGACRLYNVDVPPEQMYLYENDLFPLAYCEVSETSDGLSWDLQDDTWSCRYEVPELRSVELDVRVRKAGRMARVSDPIESISLKAGDGSSFRIEGGPEDETLLELVEEVARLDPDLIFTSDGDSFVLPYLIERAKVNGVAERLVLDREGGAMELPTRKGTSYFSYGKILFKPAEVKMRGRIHLDTNSSFVHRETGLEGFYEVSRVCRLPLHTASRASIGKALSSLQFYHAAKDGILIPWKPTMAESFKSRAELLAADRGGFIFEPELGVHEGVGELDFSSLFPSIMWKKNISPETVRCACCPDSKNRVPELGWNVCERRPEGIVSKAVKILVEKRMKYKRLEKGAEGEEKERYEARRDALKWVGVACLPRESPVLIRKDGVDGFARIGDFIDSIVGDRVGVVECPPGVYVAGVDLDCKAKYCKVAYLIKKPNDQKLLSFVMEDGRKIVTTPDHSFFILRGGELETVRADELRVGELVPVGRRILSPATEMRQIDLIERLESLLTSKEKQLWRVSGQRLRESIKAKRQTLIGAAISEGRAYQSVISWTRSGIIPLRFLKLPGLMSLVAATRTSSEPHARAGFRQCPVQVDQKISRMLFSRRSDGNRLGQVAKIERPVSGDLGFVRVRRIEELDSCPEHVYCFQLAKDEVPGFFTGQGVILTRNCFGYLGFNNAKFGRIDAHIAVCAWDRKVLVDAARVAERRGFRVMHGIVDSLWLKRGGAGADDYEGLRREIEAETRFPIAFEGVFKWIAFLPSKVNAGIPVLNRYFGAYDDGRLKVRGIDARRHDTPAFFSKCQLEILETLSGAGSVAEARAKVGECVGIFLRHARSLLDHSAPIEGLVFTRNLSKKPGEYANRSLTSIVADQLVKEGMELHAGEGVRYVITDYRSRSPGRRALAFELVDEDTAYDAERYVELLAEVCSTVLQPFRADCSKERLTQIVEEGSHGSLA